MPYMPYVLLSIATFLLFISPLRFPSTWPVFTPARKLANWLEYYAEAMEIPLWTSSIVLSASRAPDNKWHIIVARDENRKERKIVVNHLIFATGLGGGAVKEFEYPGLVSIR